MQKHVNAMWRSHEPKSLRVPRHWTRLTKTFLPSFSMNALQKFSLSASATAVTSMVYASSALAQFAGPDPEIPGTPGSDEGDAGGIRTIIEQIIVAVLNFLALIAVVVVIIAGIRLIVSQGNDEEKDKAKKAIFYALAGLIIVLFARVIVGLVTSYLAGSVDAA